MAKQRKRYRRIEIKFDPTDDIDMEFLELWKLAKRIARENGMTAKGLLMKAIEAYLDNLTKGGENVKVAER